MRYGENGKKRSSHISFRWNKEHSSFYIYNTNRPGKPKCLATLRVSDHGPELFNYIDPEKTDFNYPSDEKGMNFSIEFYDPRHRYDKTFMRPAPYEFLVDRFCYAAPKLTKQDIDRIIVNMVAFIEDPTFYQFVDPLSADPDKRAFKKFGKAFKANVRMKFPENGYDGPLNHFDTYESIDPEVRTYMFETFDLEIDLKDAVREFISYEKQKRRLYESVMTRMAPIIKSMVGL